jgi:hypothetical protein
MLLLVRILDEGSGFFGVEQRFEPREMCKGVELMSDPQFAFTMSVHRPGVPLRQKSVGVCVGMTGRFVVSILTDSDLMVYFSLQ